MWLFEADYENKSTEEMVTRAIEFDGDTMFNTGEECWAHATERACSMTEADESLLSVNFVAY